MLPYLGNCTDYDSEHEGVYIFSSYPEAELLDQTVNSSTFNLMNLHTVFQVGIPIYIPINSAQAFPLLHLVICLFDNGHFNRREVISHCGFDLHFPDD